MTDSASPDAPRVSPIPEGSKEGPLAPFRGQQVPAPDWFARAIAQGGTPGTVEVEGARVSYRTWGQPHRPGLLLTHGNGAHEHWWDFIAPYLARDYHVVAMTLSGMGDSDWRESYSMEVFAREQMAVCEATGLFDHEVPPIVVGHSFGGFVTILTGALYGERLSGTVLVDSPVNPPDRHSGGPPRGPRPNRVYPDLASGLARFRLAPPQECENLYIVDHIARRSLKPVEGGWTWKFDPNIWQRFSIGNTSNRLRETRCRIGIFRGEYSVIFPPDVGDYMFGLLGHAVPVIEIPEARHHIMLDQPLAFVSALRALLTDWDHSQANRVPPQLVSDPMAALDE